MCPDARTLIIRIIHLLGSFKLSSVAVYRCGDGLLLLMLFKVLEEDACFIITVVSTSGVWLNDSP